MRIGYMEISQELFKDAYGKAWSVESMETGGAGGRGLEYIGSRIEGELDNDRRNGWIVYDYYRDDSGNYWYGNRAFLPSGELVSMERYLFGRDMRDRRRAGKNKRGGRRAERR